MKRPEQRAAPKLDVARMLSEDGAEGFERAYEKRPFVFPEDFGPHPEFQTEWWYYTGNVTSPSGRRFGYQLTFFRRGLSPENPDRESKWGTNQVYFAHFALSDIREEEFHSYERWGRGSMGLAGAAAGPFKVWVGEWSVKKTGDLYELAANAESVSIDLKLNPLKPVVLQGDEGLSQKSKEPGNASYYFSQTRLETSGTVSVEGGEYEVRGLSWLDREWSTSALGPEQEGWDWFSLQFDDGRELMLYRLRLKGGGMDASSSGTLVSEDGSVVPLSADEFEIEVLDRWKSPDTGIVYPSGWLIKIPGLGMEFAVTPYQAGQELLLSFVYWEGAVGVSGGGLEGSGYVELTGYGDSL
ncbi:MAG: lipocalin-like domain-containing protein [Deltaproteobacteria bacterium]